MNKITTCIEYITPEIAKEYLKCNILNRGISQSHVSDLCEKMESGKFEFNGESIIFSNGNVLLDGQHRLLACVKTKIPFTSVVVRGVEQEAFHTIDIGRNRSAADVFAIARVPDANKVASIIQNYVRLNNGSVSIFENRRRMEGLKVTRKDMLDFYMKNKEIISNINLFSARCYAKVRLLKHSEIGGIAVYLILGKKHPEDLVKSFFRMLFFNEGVTNKTINVLRDKLINNLASEKRMIPRFKYSIIAKCWNAYLLGKELKVLSWNEAKEGVVYFK